MKAREGKKSVPAYLRETVKTIVDGLVSSVKAAGKAIADGYKEYLRTNKLSDDESSARSYSAVIRPPIVAGMVARGVGEDSAKTMVSRAWLQGGMPALAKGGRPSGTRQTTATGETGETGGEKPLSIGTASVDRWLFWPHGQKPVVVPFDGTDKSRDALVDALAHEISIRGDAVLVAFRGALAKVPAYRDSAKLTWKPSTSTGGGSSPANDAKRGAVAALANVETAASEHGIRKAARKS